MEYIDGVNLRRYITKNAHNKAMTEEQALSVMRPVLQAPDADLYGALRRARIKADDTQIFIGLGVRIFDVSEFCGWRF